MGPRQYTYFRHYSQCNKLVSYSFTIISETALKHSIFFEHFSFWFSQDFQNYIMMIYVLKYFQSSKYLILISATRFDTFDFISVAIVIIAGTPIIIFATN